MLKTVIFFASGGETPRNPLIPESYDIIWSSVCFLVILVIFWRVILPRMKKLLDERSAAIEGNIEKANSAKSEAESVLEQYRAQLAEARAEAGAIRDQARQDGQRILAELKEQASAEAARITAHAQVQIEAERQAALVSLRTEVGSLALDLASGVIGESLKEDKRSAALVDRFLADIEAQEQKAVSS